MYLIAGLGNPGKEYEMTRHNIGFEALDYMADQYHKKINHLKFKALYEEIAVGGEKVFLVKPQTYMNLSGESIREFSAFYKIPPEHIIIIHDDISLAAGRVRVRKKGSAGGHNGVKDIIAKIGPDQFPRIKVGVGAKPENWDLADYVLSRFSQGERRLVDEAAAESVEALALMVQGRIEEAMNLYNRKKTVKESNDGNSL